MKMMHLSDLHVGKKLGNYLLEEDQEHILREILQIAEEQKPDCILIAGDVFDKSVPAASAVTMFDRFLGRLAALKIPTLIDSGNHDSNERLAYCGWALRYSNIFVSPVYDGKVEPVTLQDEYGEVRFWMMPYIRPMRAREVFDDSGIETYDEAFGAAIKAMQFDPSERNVLLAHQFVTGATVSDSENHIIGTLECVGAEHFKDFDYTALGHLHTRQDVTSERIHYCGTPLKYSFSEWKSKKSVTMIELGEKGTALKKNYIQLHPLRDLYELRGSFAELIAMEPTDDFVYIKLTDPKPIPNAKEDLETRFEHLMQVSYAEREKKEDIDIGVADVTEQRSPYEIIAEFYKSNVGKDMDKDQSDYLTALIHEIWEAEHETTEA